jgi:hypothetical protein
VAIWPQETANREHPQLAVFNCKTLHSTPVFKDERVKGLLFKGRFRLRSPKSARFALIIAASPPQTHFFSQVPTTPSEAFTVQKHLHQAIHHTNLPSTFQGNMQ